MQYIPEDLLQATKNAAKEENLDADLQLINDIILQNHKFLNVVDKYGRTPLHLAILWEYPEKIKLLINAGANLEARDAQGRTPLFYTIKHIKAKLKEKNSQLKVDLYYAPKYKYNAIEIAQLLLDAGAKIEARDVQGRTPLFYAVKNMGEDFELAQLFLNAKANVDVQDKNGKTIFMTALTDDHEINLTKFIKNRFFSKNELLTYNKLLVLLEQSGADLNLKDKDGNSSYDFMEQLDYYNLKAEAQSYQNSKKDDWILIS